MRHTFSLVLVALGALACDPAVAPLDAPTIDALDAPAIDTGPLDAPASIDAARDGGTSAEGVWAPLSHLVVVDPTEHGAVVDDGVDDGDALEAAIAALPAEGGIVLFPPGTYLKDHRLLRIRRSHVHLWAPNGRATLHGTVHPRTTDCGVREQATIFEETTGGGVYGLRFTSNAEERMACAEDNQIVLDAAAGTEIIGVEIEGSSGTGIFAWSRRAGLPPSRDLFIEGNFVHHTYADSIHHTSGTRRSHVWDNDVFNESPSDGDDGVACVTYGVDSPRCGELEWWGNRYLGGTHGRGYAVIGGEDILIHHNWVVRSSAAGVIVASEGGYDSASSERIRIESNWLSMSPDGTVDNGHAGILVSGGNASAPPLSNVVSVGNVIVGAAGGRVERAEGRYDAASVTFDDATDPALFPSSPPSLADAHPRDTTVLRTRDTSFVTSAEARGLYRIHVRERADGMREERFEYVLRGTTAEIEAWLASLPRSHVPVRRDESDTTLVVLVPAPVVVPAAIEALSFDGLREGDRSGSLSWLWSSLDGDAY